MLTPDTVLPVLAVLLVASGLNVVCRAVVSVVALVRANRTDTVAIVQALPDLAPSTARRRGRPGHRR